MHLNRLQDKVNTLLLRRMSTLRRELVQVSELMRDNTNPSVQQTAPVASMASTSAAPQAALPVANRTVVQPAAEQGPTHATLDKLLALSGIAPASSAYTVGDVQLAQLAGQLEPIVR